MIVEFRRARPLSAPDLALFAELLAGLVRSGIPLPEAVRIIGKDAESRRLKKALRGMDEELASGAPLVDVLARRRGAFPELFSRLVEQGCAANDLHAALVELVREYHSQLRFREQLHAKLISPISTVFVIGLILVILTVLNYPVFLEEVYNYDLWAQRARCFPPWPTAILIEGGRFARDPETVATSLIVLVAMMFLATRLWRSERVRYWIQRFVLQMPTVGPYLRTAFVARFCRLLALLLKRGIRINTSLELLQRVLTWVPQRTAVIAACERVEQGVPVAEALGESRLFPRAFRAYFRGAQARHDLPNSLTRLAVMYEERGDLLGTKVRLLIYIFAQAGVGLLVLFLILAYFLPAFTCRCWFCFMWCGWF